MNNISEILGNPFPKSLLETRQGRGGKTLTYIPWPRMFDRMDEAYGAGSWSFVIVKEWIEEDFILCTGFISLPDGSRMYATDGTSISRFTSGQNQGKPVDLGDDYKTAETNCAVKCLQRLGIGRYLSDPQRRHLEPQQAQQRRQEPDNEGQELEKVKNQVRRLIWKSNNGIREKEHFEAFCKHVTGVGVEEMNLHEWKRVLKELEEYVAALEKARQS